MTLRVVLTTDVAGGVWTYAEELVDALRERGHSVLLVVLGQPRREHRAWLAPRPGLEIEVIDAPLEWEPEPEPGLSASLDPLRRIVARWKADVVHLNQFYYAAFDLGAPALVVAHSDVVGWWRAVKRAEPPADAWFRRYRGWVGAGLRGAAARVAPTAWMAAQAQAIYGAPAPQVIGNARSARHFEPRPDREPLALTAGRLWDEGKGALDLASAAALLRRERSAAGMRVLAAGPVEHPAGGAGFRPSAEGLEWAGVLPWAELASLLGRAAVYVGTSRYEPFGLVPLEAALAGCALALSDIPTFRELWDGVALFYPPGNVRALAELLLRLHAEPATRAELAEAARRRALDRFTPERMAAAYEDVYAALLRS